MVSILCADSRSSYYKLPGLDIYDQKRDAYSFAGRNMVIAHPPCQQWSRLRKFSNYDLRSKLLAYWCWDIVNQNGGIFEHPAGSYFFKHVNADRKKIISVDQCWFGFSGKKTTYLYFHNCSPDSFPILKLPEIQDITSLGQRARSLQTLEFSQWLLASIGLS